MKLTKKKEYEYHNTNYFFSKEVVRNILLNNPECKRMRQSEIIKFQYNRH